MLWKFIIRSSYISMAIVLAQFFVAPAYSQSQQNPNVSVVRLIVQQNSSGGQSVLTPKGVLVPMPGAGVGSNYLDLYMGAKGGYWYVDRNGQTEDITSYVQKVRGQSAQMQMGTPPQYAPYDSSNSGYSNNGYSNTDNQNTNNQNTNNQNTNNQNTNTSSSGGGSSALATATAAGVGAMAGAAMSNYHNVPYGSQMYYGPHSNPYYRNVEGKDVFVNDGEVQWNNVAKGKSMQNYKQTQNINDAKAYQQQRNSQQQAQVQQAQTERQTNQNKRQANQNNNQEGRRGDMQSQNFQKQDQWYQNQSKDKGRAQAWQQQSSGENPFVRNDGGGRSAAREASGERGGGREARGGREGRGSRQAGGFGGARGGGGRRGR